MNQHHCSDDSAEAPRSPEDGVGARNQQRRSKVPATIRHFVGGLTTQVLKLGAQTFCGVFDDAEEAAAAAVAHRPKGNLYFTPNELAPGFRDEDKGNSLTPALAGEVVSDEAIVRRRWIWVDIDPVRVGEISSDDELQEAKAVALEIEAYHDAQGWPTATVGMSGNGYYVCYRVDLPNTPQVTACVRGWLGALGSGFGTDTVRVDLSVANPGRSLPLFGTRKRKGEHTVERPHRMSRLLRTGEHAIVELHQIEAVISDLGGVTPLPHREKTDTAIDPLVDLGGILDEAGYHYRRVRKEGVTWFNLELADGCPFGESSGNRGKCGPGQRDDGKLVGKCFADESRSFNDFATVLALWPFLKRAGWKREVMVTGRETNEVASECWSAMEAANDPVRLVTFNGKPAVIQDDAASPLWTLHTKDELAHVVDREVAFRRLDRQRNIVAANPPAAVIRDMTVAPRVPFPELVGTTDVPFLTPSGRVVTTPGYDSETRVALMQSDLLDQLAFPDVVTANDVHESVLKILDILQDFPFGEQSNLANAVAKLIDPFIRPALPTSLTPLTLVTSPTPGTGKGTLIDTVLAPAIGGVLPRTSLPHDEEELRKKLTSFLAAGQQRVLFDNVDHTIASPTLALFVTAPYWNDRRLGTNDSVSFRNASDLFINGNNLSLGGDLPRRAMLIRLDSGVERPEDRTDFHHQDVVQYALANRVALVRACLTVVSAWASEGMPRGDVAMANFSPWSMAMAGVLGVAGIDGFLQNAHALHDVSDVEGDGWRAAYLAWSERWGDQPVTSNQVADLLEDLDWDPTGASFLQGGARAKKVTAELKKRVSRVYAGLAVEAGEKQARSGSQLWRMRRVSVSAVLSEAA